MGFKEDLIVQEQYFYDQTIVSDNCCDAAELYCYNVRPIAVQQQPIDEPVKRIELKKTIKKTQTSPNFPITNKRSYNDESFDASYGFDMNSLSDKFFKLGNISHEISHREQYLITAIKSEACSLDRLTQRLNRLRQSATFRFTTTLNWS